MAGRDESTYGFNRDDADSLISMIGMVETETPRRFGGGGGGGGSGETLFGFTLASDMSAKSGSASIYRLDGDSVGEGVDGSVVYDPQDIFSTLLSGATGLCIKQGSLFYIIQAKCPEEYL